MQGRLALSQQIYCRTALATWTLQGLELPDMIEETGRIYQPQEKASVYTIHPIRKPQKRINFNKVVHRPRMEDTSHNEKEAPLARLQMIGCRAECPKKMASLQAHNRRNMSSTVWKTWPRSLAIPRRCDRTLGLPSTRAFHHTRLPHVPQWLLRQYQSMSLIQETGANSTRYKLDGSCGTFRSLFLTTGCQSSGLAFN